MPANRRRRRANAARARRQRRAPGTRALPGRLLLGGAGVVLVIGAIVLIATPHGVHMGRGLYFALILGGILLCTAILPR